MLAPLPRAVSSIFLNEIIFASYGIAMLSNLLTHLKPSTSENLLLEILYITRLDMGLGKSSIDYIPYVHEISQRMKGVTMEKIIPLLFISSLDQGRYPVVKRQYLAVNPALVKCNLLYLSGILSRK